MKLVITLAAVLLIFTREATAQIACAAVTPCQTALPEQACMSPDSNGVETCVCPIDHFLVNGLCVARSELVPRLFGFFSRKCRPNSKPFYLRRSSVCVCEPGTFAKDDVCHPIVARVPMEPRVTTQAPVVKLQCRRWPVPGAGVLTDTLVFMTGDIIRFECHEGTTLYGPTQSRCMEDGNFQEVYPLCLPDEFDAALVLDTTPIVIVEQAKR